MGRAGRYTLDCFWPPFHAVYQNEKKISINIGFLHSNIYPLDEVSRFTKKLSFLDLNALQLEEKYYAGTYHRSPTS